jgi:hypothetical protein
MKSNPILEEVWRVKDELAREAGYDIHRMCEDTRKWAEANPRSGPVVNRPEELHKLAAEEERKREEASASTLKEDPPPQD